MEKALGLIETLGLTTAVTALDAASKAADVTLVGVEKVIGVGKAVGVTIQVAGEVAAVRAAVDAGEDAGNRVGIVVSSHVIPRPHEEVAGLIKRFEKNLKVEKNITNGEKTIKQTKKSDTDKNQTNREE